jgi:HSP20 family protein
MLHNFLARELFQNSGFNFQTVAQPKGFLKNSEENISLEIELPGVRKEDIEINLKGNSLQVLAKRKFYENDKETEGEKKVLHEKSFEQWFELTEKIDSQNIQAKLEDGILTLNLAKVSAPDTRKILVS